MWIDDMTAEQLLAALGRVRASFDHAGADCTCVYCTKDVEGITMAAADYEMQLFCLQTKFEDLYAKQEATRKELDEVRKEKLTIAGRFGFRDLAERLTPEQIAIHIEHEHAISRDFIIECWRAKRTSLEAQLKKAKKVGKWYQNELAKVTGTRIIHERRALLERLANDQRPDEADW